MANDCITEYKFVGTDGSLRGMHTMLKSLQGGAAHSPVPLGAIVEGLILNPLQLGPESLYMRGEVDTFDKPYKLEGRSEHCMDVVEVAAWRPCSLAMELFAKTFGAVCNWYSYEPGNAIYEKHDPSSVFEHVGCVVAVTGDDTAYEEVFPGRKEAEEYAFNLGERDPNLDIEVIDVDEI